LPARSFFFSAVAGVEPNGKELWRIAPAVVGVSEQVTEAAATVWTPKGSLSTGWQLHSREPWLLGLNASVPVGLRVVAALPLPPASGAKCSIASGADRVWQDGSFVAKPETGVAGAAVTRERRFADGAIALTLESGVYDLQMRC